MKNDKELEMLLDEIPHATSHNIHNHQHHHHHHHPHHLHQQHNHTHLVGHGLNGGNSFSDNGSPTTPPSEELKPHMPCGNSNSHYPDGLWLDSKIPVSSVRNKTNESLIDELSLCRNLSNVYISNGKEDFSNLRDFSVDRDRLLYRDCSFSGSNQTTIDKHGDYDNVRRGFSDYMRFQSPVPSNAMSFDGQMSPALSGLQQEHNMGSLLGSRVSPRQADKFFPQFNYCNSSMNFPWQNTKEQIDNYYLGGSPVSNFTTSLSGPPMAESLSYAQQDGMNLNEARGVLNLLNTPQMTSPRPHLSVENALHLGLPLSSGRTRTPLNIRIPQPGLESLTSDESFIIQGEALNHSVNKGFNPSRGRSKVALHEIGMSKRLERSQLDGWHQSARINFPFSLPPKYNSLAEAQGYIYLLAKDQYGCRFLQRIFDEGTPKDVQIVFNEIINYVVELMVNPFGNYLMQKLLDVCNEEQRLQILLMVTAEPGQLVRISLNPHGTRVVQKLIETLKTRQQISLVISALEPGFLALIKDLNGNHVIQRCLQCLSHEDNKFIFVAAAKYCVDIAIHQHGCCVLQRCISHSIGEHRENLVTEISANGLLLSQDAYGNYVIQFILELRIPSATSNLISQFEGNYVHLSKQKFGSHVVEKCLMVFNDECQSRLIHELLSVPQFERLLQDPHANYVVQTALRVSEGPIHNALVEAIESRKAISRNSPYSKRIFSQKLLKK
ncbi:putative pumilio homolog 7, chloroplastic isoform X2 [Castanea sativa]|uniref:putative pumilio homolog 7, chloroplastic isoform X2 n=1 Tax=Castanea sativa TaxID=21020 RepID=UPI003F6548F1